MREILRVAVLVAALVLIPAVVDVSVVSPVAKCCCCESRCVGPVSGKARC